MSSSDHPFHLWIASDDAQAVVAMLPLKIAGAQLKHEWGSITDLRALRPAPRSRNFGGLIVLALIVVVISAALCLGGAPLMVVLILAALVIGPGSVAFFREESPGHVVAPDLQKFPEIHRVLDAGEEREDFLDLVELAERAGRSLPALDGLVDAADAGEALAHALWVGADALGRRKQLRSLVDGLKQNNPNRPSATSRAAGYLTEQRKKAKGLWDQANEKLARVQATLEAAAVAGENFIREQELMEAARRGEEALVGLAPHDLEVPGDASGQLAEGTAAVLDAYRELNDLYGDRS